jgi:hypothetical protein
MTFAAGLIIGYVIGTLVTALLAMSHRAGANQ